MSVGETTPALDAQLDLCVRLADASHDVIVRHQSASGAYPASPSFSAYSGYCWFRDGAFIADGVRRYGDHSSSVSFHKWCARVLLDRSDQVDNVVSRARRGELVPVPELLPTRYELDGAEGNDPWWDFQLDGYGTWLWAVAEQVVDLGDGLEAATAGVPIAVRYLAAFWDRPCYDWWEEHVQHRHVSTLGAVRAGLAAVLAQGSLRSLLTSDDEEQALAAMGGIDALVADEGIAEGHLTKWLGSRDVDASLLACMTPFALPIPPAVAAATVAVVEDRLAVDGGVHRYAEDTFFGGGQWPLLSAFLGWNHAVAGDRAAADRYLNWIAEQATPGLELPEQVPNHLLAPERRQEWLDRWGPVATPLLWSHGMYLVLATELGITGAAA